MQHNNFGICDQVLVKSKDEGLSRVKAFYEGADRTIESDKAEVASYQNISTLKPDYSDFLKDLYSKSQSGQEFQTFDSFYQHFDHDD